MNPHVLKVNSSLLFNHFHLLIILISVAMHV